MADSNCSRTKRFDLQLAVTLSLLLQTLVSLIVACIPIVAPAVASDRGWSVRLVTLYPTILYIAAFFVSFGVPHLLRVMGGMGLSVGCLTLSAVGLLCLLSPEIALVAGVSLTAGIATASMNPASSQVLGSRTTSRNAAFVMSVKQTGVPLGGVLAGILVPVLVTWFTWRGAVLALFATGIVMALLLIPVARWIDAAAKSTWSASYRPLAPVKELLATPNMPPILVASFFFTAMQMCLRTFFTIYLVSELRLSLVAAGLAFSVSQAAGIIGQVGWATVADRLLSTRWVIILIGLLMITAAGLTATMTVNWPMYAVIAVAAAFGLSASAFVPIVLGEIARRASPGSVGALTSGIQMFILAGAIVGPLVFGAIASRFGFPGAFIAMAGCTLVVPLVLILPAGVFHGKWETGAG